ncbi:LrgB family protein [Anaerobacillus isosaccharinicus]|uniref:LrgB family protein n=1 Tax=Anaerobacillus isosaccharinicus TaxID=1532552 RepID=A0A1S2LI56_9BACI|nr:LrgB family protein [Anaerobacillus isosaccharinicus]MBA5588680.1 LrgB family protein [Anaerobacillus isosaccharinicus]QOY37916.1 LrgB family protein [Anaerobacillus isosaccharinicus]
MIVLVTLLSIAITVGAYLLSRVVGKRYPSPFTTPVFFSTAIIIIILLTFGFTFEDYTMAKDIMTFLLGPATVALAVPFYKNREIIKKHSGPAIVGIVFGTISTIIGAVLLAKLLTLSNEILASVSVKSVTVPVAIEISNIIGGDPALTAAFVVATGIIGTMLGPSLMNLTNIDHPLSRGLALGTISHGQGTAQAATEGELQGAIAGVAMGLAAIFTAIAAPIIVPFFI